MVARAECYCGTPFRGQQGVTLRGRLSPTIFNMVVEAVIRHWVVLVMGEEAVSDSFGRLIQCLVAFFYAHNSLIDSPRPARIQADLDVFMVLFDRVGLHTTVNKTVEMLCHPCHIVFGNL